MIRSNGKFMLLTVEYRPIPSYARLGNCCSLVLLPPDRFHC